ncbi:Protein of uncharacterised function (DUF3296) [Escherichia coli]|nr:Protein of uncharacterised function (DUF3296) [Escherichia coli]
MNQPIHNDYWLSRFESILNSALVQHRAVSLIRVDLRFPEHMPVTIMDPDPDSAVISRFFESLKAKIQAYQRKNDVPTSVCVQPPCIISGVGSLARKKAGNIIT